MSTTTVRLSTGVTACSWRLSNGMSGSWSLQDGISQSWTRTAGSLYFTGFSLGSNYSHPIYFERDDGYVQQVTNSSGGWVDNEVAFTNDKTGTLTATYHKPIQYYTISYNANGGSGAPSSQVKTENVTLTLSSDTPTWSGHTFWGWSTSSARDAAVQYSPGGSYTANAGVTLYAVWVVTATFYSKGSVYSRSIKRIGESVTLPSPANTSTQGCSGWLYNGETYSCGSSITINSDISFTAIWTNIYTVSYNANGGSGAPASQTKWHGTDLTITSSKPTWSGHTFLGWSTNSARDAVINYPAGSTYSDNAAIILYAVWLCSASFYSKGTLVQTRTARINGTIILPILQDTETEVFNGWLSNDETFSGGAELKLTADVSFVAIWVAGYKLTYNGSNPDSGTMPSPPLAVTYTISSCSFVKNGFFFRYWRYTDEYDDEVIIYPGDTLTPKSDITLYAAWKRRVYFYWHGSDANDSARFAAGKKIENALTATAWNSLCDFINKVRTDIRLPTIAFARVSAGDPISAVKFNIVSNAIHQIVNAGYGTVVPATVSAGEEIVTSLFNGRGSLKDAINKAVDEL